MQLWVKSLHIISVISWMAALLYLPRLFVYHTQAPVRSPQSETFKVMEHRLLRIIMTPAMLATWVTGLSLLYIDGIFMARWLHVKLLLVLLLSAAHGYMARCVREFAQDRNTKTTFFYRMLNEVPTILMICVIILVVVKPF